MEKFEDLFEDYLDEEEINQKKQLDFEEVEIKKTNSKYKHNFENTITMYEFINNYLDVKHDCGHLRHADLKTFNSPYIIGVSNDFAIKNKEYVLKNEILIVLDSYNNPAAYVSPVLLRQITSVEQLKYIQNMLEKVRLSDLTKINEFYEIFTIINQKITELNLFYSDGSELLKTLNKKNVLNEIKLYVKKLYDSSSENERLYNSLINTLNIECTLLDKREEKTK